MTACLFHQAVLCQAVKPCLVRTLEILRAIRTSFCPPTLPALNPNEHKLEVLRLAFGVIIQ